MIIKMDCNHPFLRSKILTFQGLDKSGHFMYNNINTITKCNEGNKSSYNAFTESCRLVKGSTHV